MAEEELERLAAEIQLQQSRGDAIRQQMQQMQSSLIEIGGAIDAINGLKKAKGNTLVPLGAGAFISCPKPDSEHVTLSIGANIMIQKKPDEAIKYLQERQKKIADAVESAQGDLQEIIKAINAMSQQANALAEAQNVRAPKE